MKVTKKVTIEKPPECWIEQQPTTSKKKIYGIWARYDTSTKSRIEKECSNVKGKEKKRKVTHKKIKGK